MERLRRLMPRRLAAQMAAVVILVVVVIQSAVSLSFHLLHDRNWRPGEHVHLDTLIPILAAEESGDDRRRMVAELARIFPDLSPRLTSIRPALRDPPPRGSGPGAFGGGPIADLAVRLGDRVHIAFVDDRPPASAPSSTPPPPPRNPEDGIDVAIGFHDGEWLILRDRPPPRPPFLDPFVASIGFAVVSVLLLGLWAARNLVRPLRSLASAARDFDIESEPRPLIEAGPEEVRIASRAFDAMRDRIRTLVRDRTGMLAAVGHDLRTPITRLRLRSEFLTDEAVRAEFLRDLELMNDMVEGALTYLREGRHDEKLSLVDVAALVATVCDQFEDLGHAVTYEGPGHLALMVRSQSLGRALTNLVDNACKYGRTIAVRLSARCGGGCRIEVEDDGPGIAEAEREAMSRPFVRGDAARSLNDAGGFGLGLAIVRAVVDGHRGTMTLGSGRLGGLLVTLEIPTASPAPSR